MKTAYNLGVVFGKLVITYAFVYPIIYFSWNYIITELNYQQYIIPGFWFGMLCYMLFNLCKNLIFKGI